MKLFISLLTLSVLVGMSGRASAKSSSMTCSDSYGAISVVDGNVVIKDGVGDVGQAKSLKVLKDVLEKTENCVEGPNYVWTKVTVQELTYNVEEDDVNKAIVLCTEVQTGIDNSCR